MTNACDTQYLDLMRHIRDNGVVKTDRTGTGTKSIFGCQMRFDLKEGFPLLTTKKLFTKGIIAELLWFLQGDTNAKTLQAQGVKIWDEWAPTARTLADKYFKNGINVLAKKSEELGRNVSFPDDILSHIQDPMYILITKDRNAVPAGWDITESSKDVDGQPFLECYHPDFWPMLLDMLIKHRYAPANVKDKIGDLGPVYGAQWRNWQMIVEEEDDSNDAYLQRYMAWMNESKGATEDLVIAMGNLIDKKDGTVLAGIVSKTYHSDQPYYLVRYNVITEESVEDNFSRAFAYIRDRVDNHGEGSAPIMKYSVKSFDQISWLINRLKTQPDCRRMIVSAWNVADLPKMALSPCHALFQFWTRELTLKERLELAADQFDSFSIKAAIDGDEGMQKQLDVIGVPKYALSCQLYQRSADFVLGVPFNIASYALLTMMIAQVTNMVPDEFIWTGGDTHLYLNHMEQVETQLKRDPYPLPKMKINPEVKDIFNFKLEDFTLEGYESHPAIKAPVAV